MGATTFLNESPSVENNADWIVLKITELLSQPLTEDGARALGEYNSAYSALKRWKKPDNDGAEIAESNDPETAGDLRPESESIKLTDQQAMEWVKNLVNADGTTGGHWTLEQAKAVQAQRSVNAIDPISFYVTINMIYADFSGVAKKVGCNSLDFYTGMSVAFLHDPDANGSEDVRERLGIYYKYIVKH